MKREDKRESILNAAHRLFELQGFKGTGVDQIASASGATKRTLYKHFGSKEGLIEAVLEQHHDQMMERMKAQLSDQTMDPKEQILICFDLYRNWFNSQNFAGCIFIKTINEFASCSPNLSKVAQNAKQSMRDLICELATKAEINNPELLADQLQLLLEGSIIMAQGGNGSEIIETAKSLATNLIDQAEST